jgi:hypothetical protein
MLVLSQGQRRNLLKLEVLQNKKRKGKEEGRKAEKKRRYRWRKGTR